VIPLQLGYWQHWALGLGSIAASILLALGIHRLLFYLFRRLAGRTATNLDNLLIDSLDRPARWILPLLATLSVLGTLPVSAMTLSVLRHGIGLALIGCVAWLLLAMVGFAQEAIVAHHVITSTDNLDARRIQTQVQVLKRVAAVLIVVLTLGVMLMTFPSIRHVGESLFASAGLAALVVGVAARAAITNLLAGVQIAFTQPIRLEDVVIVEGEWGWVEEINTTYVVVRIWDLRRLVVPLSYFIEKPFQNWTRRTADLLGTVFVYTDYSVPVDEVRSELLQILQSSGMWDGQVWGLQVTNASEHTMELRALMSAPNGPRAFDLRCHVREKLIQFLQERYPESLPRTRLEASMQERVLSMPGKKAS
jgi:small-conductance mechanosensitive channel